MRNVRLSLLAGVLSLSLFSGCAEPIATFEGCPDLDIYEIPQKILVRGETLGKTNLYRPDSNVTKLLGDTDIISRLANTEHTYDNAVIMPMDLLVDIIEYTAKLREAAEKYKADREAAKKANELNGHH